LNGLFLLEEELVVADSHHEGYLVLSFEGIMNPFLNSLFWREKVSLKLGVLLWAQGSVSRA
jgi:hypothetical protein